jgi:hypothetical protein
MVHFVACAFGLFLSAPTHWIGAYVHRTSRLDGVVFVRRAGRSTVANSIVALDVTMDDKRKREQWLGQAPQVSSGTDDDADERRLLVECDCNRGRQEAGA